MHASATPSTSAIFISYPRERASDAQGWQDALRAAGRGSFVCHRDAESEKPGFENQARPKQREFLAHKIATAEAIVVLWDRNYGRAAWCAWELTRSAECAGKRLFLMNLDGTLVPRDLDRQVEDVRSADDLIRQLERAPSPLRRPTRSLARVELYPAASILESRFAPRFDARTRGAVELARMIAWLALAVGMQLAIYYGAARWLTTDAQGKVVDVRVHLWALLTATNVAMTLVGAFTLSAFAAFRAGVLGLWAALAVLSLGIAWRGEPDQHTVTTAAAAMGTFHVSLVLLLRDRLLGAPVGWIDRSPSPQLVEGRAWAHARAALGIGTVAVLVMLGLRLLDEAVELGARLKTLTGLEKLAALQTLLDVPVRLGLLVGFLVGIAIATATFRRVLGNYRASARLRVPVASGYALCACAITTWLGHETGAWIKANIVEAISSWGGSYAGAQIGVLLAVGFAVPIATGTGRLSIQQERWWGMVGALVVMAIIVVKIRSFPFAANRDGVAGEILWGALWGLAPIAALRLLASAQGRILAAALAVHLVALALLNRDAHPPASSAVSLQQRPQRTSVVLAQPRPPRNLDKATDSPSTHTTELPPTPPPTRTTTRTRRPSPPPPRGSPAADELLADASDTADSPSGSGTETSTSDTEAMQPTPQRITIVAGTYGGRSCELPRGNHTAMLQRACEGKTECDYPVNNRHGDPKVGCAKDFVAEWTCGSVERSTSHDAVVNEGYTIHLDCLPK